MERNGIQENQMLECAPNVIPLGGTKKKKRRRKGNQQHKPIKKLHKSIYGNIELDRVYCNECNTMTIVLENIKLCCDKPTEEKLSKKTERMSPPIFKRTQLRKSEKEEILNNQNGKCFYCNHELGSLYEKQGNFGITSIHYDHLIPFSFSANNHVENFVASCNFCNQYKYNKMFNDIDEAKRYLVDMLHNKKVKFLEDEEEENV